MQSNAQFQCVKLRVGNTVIWASKAKLSQQSPVFRRIFETDAGVKLDNTIDIPTFEANLVKKLVHFVHKNDVQRLELWAMQLYEIAHFYEISALKAIAYSEVYCNLKKHNLVECVSFAQKFGLVELKQHALNTIENNMMPLTCYSYYHQAEERNLEDLRNVVFRFMANNFQYIYNSENWTSLPTEVQIGILNLQVTGMPSTGPALFSSYPPPAILSMQQEPEIIVIDDDESSPEPVFNFKVTESSEPEQNNNNQDGMPELQVEESRSPAESPELIPINIPLDTPNLHQSPTLFPIEVDYPDQQQEEPSSVISTIPPIQDIMQPPPINLLTLLAQMNTLRFCPAMSRSIPPLTTHLISSNYTYTPIGINAVFAYMLHNRTPYILACRIFASLPPSYNSAFYVSSMQGFIHPMSKTYLTVKICNYRGKFTILFKPARHPNIDAIFNDNTPCYQVVLAM